MPRKLGLGVVVAVALGASSSASAATFCVSVSPCPEAGTAEPTVQAALNAAGAAAGHDVVRIGAGTFESADMSGFNYAPGSPTNNEVTIVGSGRSVTTLRAPIPQAGSPVIS